MVASDNVNSRLGGDVCPETPRDKMKEFIKGLIRWTSFTFSKLLDAPWLSSTLSAELSGNGGLVWGSGVVGLR